jgi:hypothetical protein
MTAIDPEAARAWGPGTAWRGLARARVLHELGRDVDALAHGIAAVFRDAGPNLDGGLPPIEAYLPAAEELLQHYVANDLSERHTPIP